MPTNAEQAKEAIEVVCPGGLDRESVALYRRLFADLKFVVNKTVSEGDYVATRWTLTGTNRGRAVALLKLTRG